MAGTLVICAMRLKKCFIHCKAKGHGPVAQQYFAVLRDAIFGRGLSATVCKRNASFEIQILSVLTVMVAANLRIRKPLPIRSPLCGKIRRAPNHM